MSRARVVAGAALLLGMLALGARARADAISVSGSCSVRFFASSTMHDFEGEAPCAAFAVEPPAAMAPTARASMWRWRR